MTVEVWEVPLHASPGRLADCDRVLSDDERARALAMTLPRHRDAYVIFRAALREVLALRLERDPASIRFAYGEHGRPELAGGDDLAFNVSHSDGLALVAVAPGRARRLGVDIERLGRERAAHSVAARCFTAAERAAIEALPEAERHDAFLRCWTAKEAYVKALGRGLTMPLDSFEVSIDGSLRLVRGADGAPRLEVRAVEGIPGHCGAVAADGGPWSVVRRRYQPPASSIAAIRIVTPALSVYSEGPQ